MASTLRGNNLFRQWSDTVYSCTRRLSSYHYNAEALANFPTPFLSFPYSITIHPTWLLQYHQRHVILCQGLYISNYPTVLAHITWEILFFCPGWGVVCKGATPAPRCSKHRKEGPTSESGESFESYRECARAHGMWFYSVSSTDCLICTHSIRFRITWYQPLAHIRKYQSLWYVILPSIVKWVT